jgi:hypothetical protein
LVSGKSIYNKLTKLHQLIQSHLWKAGFDKPDTWAAMYELPNPLI